MIDTPTSPVGAALDRRVLAYPATVAVAHVGILLAPTPGLSARVIAVVTGGSALALAWWLRTQGASSVVLVAYAGTVGGLAGLTVGALRVSDRLWVAALTVVLAFLTLTYGLHRYELVRLGLVDTGVADR